MERDLRLIRQIMLDAESGLSFDANRYEDPETAKEHVMLIKKVGYVEVASQRLPGLLDVHRDIRITWQGYEYLDSIREQKRFAWILDKMKELGQNLPFEIIKELGIEYLKKQML